MPLTVHKKLSADWWTPEGFEEDEAPPRFRIRPLTGGQRFEVGSHYNQNTGNIEHKGAMLALRYGLLDWENIQDEDGKTLKFSVSNITSLPSATIADLVGEILARSEVEDGAEKN